MEWASARNVARLIIDDQLSEIKTLLESYPLKTLRHIVSQKHQHCSLLFLAIKYNRLSIVDYLLRFCKADPNDEGQYDGESCPCLVLAATQNDLEIVTHLLRYGADVNGVDIYRRTALYVASYTDNYIMVRYLVASGADVNKSDYKGTTCLMVASSSRLICNYLVNSGADVNRVNYDGKTALMLSVEIRAKSKISMLLSFGVDTLFKNNYGESALFIAVMANRWDIAAMLIGKNLLSADTTVAEVYEISSCRHMIRKDPTETILLWRKAMNLRNLSKYTPLFSIEYPDILSDELNWLRNSFDYITGSAISFMITRFGLLNPYSLAIMRDAICQIEDLDSFVILYRFFLLSQRDADNRLFEKAFMSVYLMTSCFLHEREDNLEAMAKLFEALVMHIEHFFQRMASSSETADDSYPLVFQISSYLRLFINVLRKIHDHLPENFASFAEGIKTVVRADNRGPHKFSLIHLCIKNEYPASISRAFLECGANAMRIDERGKTPVHYMLESFTYRNKEILNTFLKYGFRPEKFKNGYCLCCSLRRNKLLQYPINYATLQCLAAEAVNKNQLSYENRLSSSFQNLVYSHSQDLVYSRS